MQIDLQAPWKSGPSSGMRSRWNFQGRKCLSFDFHEELKAGKIESILINFGGKPRKPFDHLGWRLDLEEG
jgi:hypothetical protein